ncbi:hypothetical protein LJU02_03555 [Corynebacterium pseudotuberculosis]|uniref:DUF6882 domain-containing protein n=1 Tax=Corynebacterium pseudotuberculosis TaxID=1719 RepID=UPI0001DD4575|nr:DUF6882 domain-containing protein [Corynebacterium pseudotuberculosis]AER68758.1 Hypothetical protein Cp106_0677 [Corynebacterium pseudotuberculosis 1/06-A]ADK28485.1 hypothetical protein CPFRC_03475 [Corynebacterium pseudotuberculosis FRC41]ADL20582.1 hypothetical protein CP1002_09660 [Corynebacterium pseudotuberculosis 1002]AEX39168.1 Hypothetical protein Cp3995_0702 [Corynebacterium pseudotuberculosis 3/99-5]AFB72026.1 hypothetical protein CP316_03610 [Corynebacterium pseudotuberculosis 
MFLPAPTNFNDVIVDGVISQAEISEAFTQLLGYVHEYEFNATPTGYQIQFHTRRGLHTYEGVLAAHIDPERMWKWAQEYTFDIPELSLEQPASDELIAAARTLNGNGPAYLVPLADGALDVVILSDVLPHLSLPAALTVGLGNLRTADPDDLKRAVLAYAAQRGLSFQEDSDRLEVSSSDGNTASIDIIRGTVDCPEWDGKNLSLSNVQSDAALVSAEHQLLFEGTYPDAHVTVDPHTATATIKSAYGESATAEATILAVVDHNWTWAWNDEKLMHSPGVTRALGLKAFAMDNGIPELLGQAIPLHRAQELALESVAKPILREWVHVVASLPDGRRAMLLLRSSQLQLPAATKASIAATLSCPLPPMVDTQRAISTYAHFRGIASSAFDSYTIRLSCSDGSVLISFNADGAIVGVN